ncbi:hypothetical protein CORT_0A04300 [Candida orthopsilosis Co 90-125]|uniref:Fibronectin type-III domain-containing protein n=1 Tax=Candida orthopsilosis (strain 90-125) TaxID=1136231 RepID=H8WWJ4_CANO9|nr:hypothetical protein CORT_0A04300 [Candida orthopsilosis Co 90-125]CCG20818.1 hypothetical protein CORT_0A04300 [Candida orthopsilosis Co 90-125]
MLEVLITIIPSVCWLLYHFYTILQTPVEKIIEDLNIEIPHIPNICIDSINESSIVIHWDIEVKSDENLYYMIVVNVQEVATLTSTSCKLNNLAPKQVYTVEVVACNTITNFKSKSKAVYVETLNKDDVKEFVENTDLLEPVSSEVNENLNTISIEQIKDIDDPKLVNSYLVKAQSELSKCNSEYKGFQLAIKDEQSTLQKELNFYKSEYEEETDSRNKKDHDVKSLEKVKNNLSFKKSKLMAQLNNIKSSLAIYNSKFQENDQKINKLKERNLHLNELEEQSRIKTDEEMEKTRQQLQKDKQQYETVEESLKSLTVEKKDAVALMNKLKPLLDQFNNLTTDHSTSPSPGPNGSSTSLHSLNTSIFNKDGSLTKNSFDALLKIFQLIPSWQDEIMSEINNYQEIENQWKSAFKAEVKNFVAIHQTLEIAKLNKDDSYQPVKLNEYQASIEFGGYGNALPKPRFSSQGKSDRRTNAEDVDTFHNHYSQVYTNENQVPSNPQFNSSYGQDISFEEPYMTQSHVAPVADYQTRSGDQSYISLKQINALARGVNMSSPLQSDPALSEPFNQNLPVFNQPSKVTSPTAQNSLLYSNLAPPIQAPPALESRFYNPGHSTSLSEVWNPPASTTVTGSSLNDFVQPKAGRATQNGFLVSPSQNIWHNDRGPNLGAMSSSSPIWRNELYTNHNQHSTSPQPREFQPFGDHINLLNIGSNSASAAHSFSSPQPVHSTEKQDSSEDLASFGYSKRS